MPSPFQQHKNRLNKKALKPGSLMKHLHDLNKDLRKAKRGEETEEPIEVIRQARRRVKQAIRKESAEEERAAMKDMDPQQVPAAKSQPSPKIETAQYFKFKPSSGMTGARG